MRLPLVIGTLFLASTTALPAFAATPAPISVPLRDAVEAPIELVQNGQTTTRQRSSRDMLNEMKARYGKTFEECQSLAVSRGYNLTDNELESRSVAMFIEGCCRGKHP
jgi:hypothetical protein